MKKCNFEPSNESKVYEVIATEDIEMTEQQSGLYDYTDRNGAYLWQIQSNAKVWILGRHISHVNY